MQPDDLTPPSSFPSARKHLILVGAGGVHVQVLKAMAARRSRDVDITVLSSDMHYWHAPNLPDWLTRTLDVNHLAFPLGGLLDAAGAKHSTARVKSLDVAQHQLTLTDGQVLPFDGISIEVGGDSNREAYELTLPGSMQHGLWVQPMDRFASLWPQVAELTRTKAMRIAVIGDGQIATALTLGVQQAIASDPSAQPCRVTLVSGANLPLAHSPPRMQKRVLNLLKSRDITVLQDQCMQLGEGEVFLGCGARLACDAAMVALLAPYPSWALRSKLGKGPEGLIDVDANGQSTSHVRVFFTRYQPVNTAGPHGFDLASQLCALADVEPPAASAAIAGPGSSAWVFLPIGARKALGCWRNHCLSGSTMWQAMRRADELALRRSGLDGAAKAPAAIVS